MNLLDQWAICSAETAGFISMAAAVGLFIFKGLFVIALFYSMLSRYFFNNIQSKKSVLYYDLSNLSCIEYAMTNSKGTVLDSLRIPDNSLKGLS